MTGESVEPHLRDRGCRAPGSHPRSMTHWSAPLSLAQCFLRRTPQGFERKVSTRHSQASGDQGRVGTASRTPRRDNKRAGRSHRAMGLEMLEGRVLLAGSPPTTVDDSFLTPVGVM